jgi:hypothetical protein
MAVTWMNLDMNGCEMECCGYCYACDCSFVDCAIVPVGEFYVVYGCPCCGDTSGSPIEVNDEWWPVQQYLLQNSEWDEGVGLILPNYAS